MKIHTAARIWGLIASIGALAQGDDVPDLMTNWPFALRVKGVAPNSSIDGYLHTTDVFSHPTPQLILRYDPSTALVTENSSYQFYFNYTGNMQAEDHELGFFVSDITVGEPNNQNYVPAIQAQHRDASFRRKHRYRRSHWFRSR